MRLEKRRMGGRAVRYAAYCYGRVDVRPRMGVDYYDVGMSEVQGLKQDGRSVV